MPVWDPHNNPRDAKHLMPILTPAYPASKSHFATSIPNNMFCSQTRLVNQLVNSAYNVGIPQLRRLQEEMIRASHTLERGEDHWRDLFLDSDFFYRHSNFVQISISAKNINDFLPWHRFCESRLRLLISALETPQISPWPFARFFKREFTKYGKVRMQHNQYTDDSCKRESFFYIALRFAPGVRTVDLRYHISDFLQKMNSWEERKEGMDLAICHVTQRDLPSFVYEPLPVNQVHATVHREKPTRPRQEPATNALPDEGNTRLTPKMARSTLLDEEIGLQSPAKKAKNVQLEKS